jgi:hypothetical protein
MERITDKINALPDGANYFSLEFFPPKTAMVGLPHVRRMRDNCLTLPTT